LDEDQEKWAIFWCDLLSPVIYDEIQVELINRFLKELAMRGAYVSQHLSFLVCGKAVGGQAKFRTGLGRSDRPGS